MLSKHGCGVVKFFIFDMSTAVPGWQYMPAGHGTGLRSLNIEAE
jgi:hypothetical protein